MKKLNLIKLFEGKQASFFPIYLMDLSATFYVKKLLSTTSRMIVNFYHQTDIVMYVEKKSLQKMCDIAQEKLINDKLFYQQVKEGMIKECHKLEKFSRCLLNLQPKNLRDKQLIKIFSDFEKRTFDLRIYAWIPNFVDMGSRSIFDIAEEEIKKQIGNDSKIKEYISKLTTPVKKTMQRRHELNLYKIQSLIQEEKIKNWGNDPNIIRLIEKNLKKYNWIAYYYIGPAWNRQDIIKILKNNLKSIKNPWDKIREIENYTKKINQEKRALRKRLKLNKETLLLLDKIATMIFLKAYRKEFLIYSNYCFEPILREIGKRLNLSLAEVRFITKEEMQKYLLNKKLLTKKIVKEIKNRLKKGCVSVAEYNKIKILTLQEGKKYLQFVEKAPKIKSKQIIGNCAYPGKIKGVARIINFKEEARKIKKGEILVSRSTNPDLIIAMQKAVAFITDEGGITCHAAIVSREMKKPCIIGTKIATKLIHDGDLVEVDAGSGKATILLKKL